MTPRAEVWLPEGVNKKDFENFLKPIGGRIDKFQESKPIPVEEISPSSMIIFLKESHPSLRFGQDPTYSQIFSKLRDLPLDEQEKLLVDFYSQKAFPNGAELGRFLTRINNISWSQPKNPPDRESLERLRQQTLSRLNLPDLALRIIKEARYAVRYAARGATREATWGAARGATREAAWGAARGAVRDAAWGAARGAARGAVLDAEWGAALNAEWIVVKDLMPQRGYYKGNPFEPLMEIYELGCWPIGIVSDQDGRKEFVVFIPSIQETS